MKILIIILTTIVLYSCSPKTTVVYNRISRVDELTNDINRSIIEDFYDNDTTNNKSIYLVPTHVDVTTENKH